MQFVAGGEQMDATRAGRVTFMPNNVRFAAMMLIKESADDKDDYKYEHPFNAYMLVKDQADTGNSLYYQETYVTPLPGKIDDFGNDNDAEIFYWQNRLHHGFIGYIDDYNKALPWAMNQSGVSGYETATEYKPKSLAAWDLSAPSVEDELGNKVENKNIDKKFFYRKKKDGTILSWQQAEVFDLTRKDGMNSISDQPDPLIACEEKIPEGSSPEKNRVYLTFRHQFAQVQVNLRGSKESANLTKEQITGVEMIGVAEEAYVFPYPEYGYDETTQTWSIVRQGEAKKDLLRLASSKEISLEQLNADQPVFNMFQMPDDQVAAGYLRGFEAIAFGNLEKLRIHWEENSDEGGLPHDVLFNITDSRFKILESGKRYVINLELRRGTLAVVTAVIDDWLPFSPEYVVDGTIVKPDDVSRNQ